MGMTKEKRKDGHTHEFWEPKEKGNGFRKRPLYVAIMEEPTVRRPVVNEEVIGDNDH